MISATLGRNKRVTPRTLLLCLVALVPRSALKDSFCIFDPRRIDTSFRVTSPSLDPCGTRYMSKLCVYYGAWLVRPGKCSAAVIQALQRCRFALSQLEMQHSKQSIRCMSSSRRITTQSISIESTRYVLHAWRIGCILRCLSRLCWGAELGAVFSDYKHLTTHQHCIQHYSTSRVATCILRTQGFDSVCCVTWFVFQR